MNPNHLLVGCPPGFDLAERLKSAVSVQLAMAFAKQSGWKLFRDSLLQSPKCVEILVGLNFGITDLALLQEWLALTNSPSSQLRVRVAPWLPIFHPKVMIARFADRSGFAIVGSGNLTGGGQHHNVECGVFLTQDDALEQVESWYKGLKSTPLTQKIIEKYRPVNDDAAKLARGALKARELVAALNPGSGAWYRDAFLSELADFLGTPRGQRALKNRVEGADRIRKALQIPAFNFDKAGFLDFYKTPEFGSIRQTYPDLVKSIAALRRSMRFLTSNSIDSDRFRSVFNRDGSQHVTGFGINQISKVLAVFDRRKWPVLNGRVWKTLEHYGYEIPWNSDGYLLFSSDMRDALSEKGKPDFWALDAFCEMRSRQLET
jgi:HKD family nuclease